MPVTFHIPGALREFTAGKSRVEIESSPKTLGEALAALWIFYPGVRDRIVTEQGQVRQHINIFIGDENVRYTGGLASPIAPGSEISIVPAVSGGSVRRDSRPSTGSGQALGCPSSAARLFLRCKKQKRRKNSGAP